MRKLCFIGFLLLSLWSSVSVADTGTYWETGWLPGRGYGPTPEAAAAEACSIWSCVNNSHSSGTNPQTWVMSKGSQVDGSYTTKSYNIFQYLSTTCPAELPYGWEDGACHVEPESEQCPAGQVDAGQGCEAICIAGEVTTIFAPINDAPSTVVDVQGCAASYLSPQNPNCKINPSGQPPAYCYFEFGRTGDYSENNCFDSTGDINCYTNTSGGNTSEETPPADTFSEGQDQQNTTNEKTITPGEPEPQPDGSTTKTDTETDIVTSDSGRRIYYDDNYIYVENSDGTTTTYQKTTTEVVEADGTKTEVISTDKIVATPNKTTDVLDKNTGSSTQVSSNSYTYNYNTQITNVYNAAGQLISSTETATGTDGDADGDGQADNGDCDPNSADCGSGGSFVPGTKEGLYEKTDKTYSSVLTGFTGRMQSAPIFSAMTGFFDVSIGGACPVWTIPSVWVFDSMTIDMQCSSVMEPVWTIVAAVLLVVAGFFAWRVAVGD